MGDVRAGLGIQLAQAEILEVLADRVGHGLMVVDPSGTVVAANAEMRRLLDLPRADTDAGGATCCEVLGCAESGEGRVGPTPCVTRATVDAGRTLQQVRVRPPGAGDWVTLTATPLHDQGGHIALEVVEAPRADAPPNDGKLRISTFGRTVVEGPSVRAEAGWLDQRPGQLLKFLLACRGRIATSEEVAEAIWPGAPFTSSGTVRRLVHALRERLEPHRDSGSPSRYLVARAGGYELNTALVEVDADGFATAADGALAAAARDEPWAPAKLEEALALYRGEFLADEPYAVWAMREREELRDQAAQLLRALSDLAIARADDRAATAFLEQLSEMEPFDNDVHRLLIETALRAGRRSRAQRQYRVFELRLQRTFGEAPEFSLRELSAHVAEATPPSDESGGQGGRQRFELR
jgi:DNA-binding SARP family transcriptional activator